MAGNRSRRGGRHCRRSNWKTARFMPTDFLDTVHLDRGARAGFISDLHLGPHDPDIEHRFRTFLEASAGAFDALFILGDLFEFWIGDDAAGLCGHLGAVRALAAFLERDECRGYLMHGNRDFLIGEQFCQQTGCRLLADPCILDYAGVPILLSHGDSYCTDDTEHQKFRALVRDHSWQENFLSRSASERLDFAHEARARSESGKSKKSMEIMDVNPLAVAAEMHRHRVGYLIHGHTHRPAIHSLTVDGAEALRFVLGAWFDRKNILTIADGAIHYAPDGIERVTGL
ncbi:MAG: UDP-2,3-diacylglucosamine diphosphatase [Proteobacteria bacterium]|nr:MAG: UDP-2,3-diacylglucosamine diphosphatase [Pseudomonadota bacterium]